MHSTNTAINKTLLILGILMMLISGLFISAAEDDEYQQAVHTTLHPELIQLHFQRAKCLFQEDGLSHQVHSSVDNKWLQFRKKFKQLNEANYNCSPCTITVQYTHYLDRELKIIYELPYFVSQQQSFLFRLNFF